MIDVENAVYSRVANAVRSALGSAYPALSTYSEYVETPNSFPCVTVVEDDNYTLTRTQDNSLREHHAVVAYTINIYTNNEDGKKALAKRIADIADGAMQDMKFTRTMRNQVPNIDRSVYRVVMRYTAIVGETRMDGDIKTNQIYRR